MLRSTNKRVGASQDWPVLYMHSCTEAATRSSISQSAKTRLGDFPPSSSVTRLTVSAAFLVIEIPARVEPVNDIIWISGWLDMAAPATAPSPWIRLNTQVQPVAKAGTTLRAIWLIGQFQGVIRPQTPIGSRRRVSPLVSSSRSG